MHEKIIELSKEKLEKDSYITEDQFYSGFQGWIADYVDDQIGDEARTDVISSFAESLVNEFSEFVSYDTSSVSVTFKEGFNEAFARSRIRMIKDTALCANDCKDFHMLAYKLHTLIGNPFGTYIYQDGITFTEVSFLRSVIPGTYYFGGVIDYHY